jgi:long-chain acyl-CoA synthetase
MEKIWLKNYPPGVPAEINPDAYQSLVEIFEKSCLHYPDHAALYGLGTTLTYQQLDELSRDFAAYLQNKLNLVKGDRIAIMLPNILQYPIALFGALRAGLVIVNVNPLYTADEVAHQLHDAEASAIIVLANFANTLEKALPRLPQLKHIIVTNLGDLCPFWKGWMIQFMLQYIYKKIPQWHLPSAIPFKQTLAKGKQLILTHVTLTNHDLAFLQYTGGTTGIAKGAMLTHRNLIANLQQADAWFSGVLQPGREIMITALPLYHIFSLTANCLFLTKLGGLSVLIANPRNLTGMIKEMKKFHFTMVTGVNTLFNALVKHPKFAQLNFKSLRVTLGGGMAVQQAVAERWQAITGCVLLEAYGLTETAPCVTINPPNLKAYNGTIGLPVSSTEVAFLDENGQEVPIGQSGELAVKGPQVMQGYWRNQAETANVLVTIPKNQRTSPDWLLTGDMGVINEQGFIHLLERKKDMILVSGFNVYPNEIEDVIAKMPGVREVAVIGVPDEHSGEVVKAFIVKDRNNDTSLTAEQVIQYCHEHLTHYKTPKSVEFRDSLPKSNVGKILRRALR